MKEKLKKLKDYIFRSWEDEGGYTHPRQKILPPIFQDIFGFIIIAAILINIGLYLWKKFF